MAEVKWSERNDPQSFSPNKSVAELEADAVRAHFGRVHIARVVREIVTEKLGPGWKRGTLGRWG